MFVSTNTQKALYSLDAETACAAPGCSGRGCRHALIPHLGRLTVWGVKREGAAPIFFRDINEFNAWLAANPQACFLGHRIAFDFKFLIMHGASLAVSQLEDCTALMATASYVKIPDEWMEAYAAARIEANRRLPRGHSHREAGKHSLKTLAPYFLGVPPFWETPANHDDEAYLEKDLEYPLRLRRHFEGMLREQGTYDFYKEKLIPWQRMLLKAELRGVRLDMALLEQKDSEARRELAAVRAKLDEAWLPARAAWEARQHDELRSRYAEMVAAAINKLKSPNPARVAAVRARYSDLEQKARQAVEPLNLDSPKQMAWLLRDHLGLDIRNFEGKESTGVEVLERLAAEGREDCALYLKYREMEKLITAFFPTYRDLNRGGVIHPDFNLDITKTGRTSSSNPNCLSLDTQVLTDCGWKFHHEVTTNTKVACYDPQSKTLIFEEPLAVYLSDVMAQPLVHVKNEHLDYVFTENHRCLFRDRRKHYETVKPAGEWLRDSAVLHGAKKHGGGLGLAPNLIRLCVAVQADACIVGGRIDFQFKKQRKAIRLAGILDELGIEYSYVESKKGYYRFGFRDDAIPLPLLNKNKTFNWVILGGDKSELDIFVQELRYWDGLVTRKNFEYCSKQEVNCDVAQAAAALCGIRAHKVLYRWKGLAYFRVYFTGRDYSLTANSKVTRYQENTQVWCLKTRTGFFLARRGPDPLITGNCQQVPGDIHDLFVPRHGFKLITKDLSAIEPRLMAYYSEDQTLFELMASDADFHGYATRMVFEEDWPLESIKKEHKKERDCIKQVDLAVFYGAGAKRVQLTSFQHGFNFSSERAGRAVRALRSAWPGVVEFKQTLDRLAEQGPIRNLLGRRRLFADDEIYMKNFNSLVQSSASDLLLESARRGLEACERRGLEAHLLLTVHDEIVVEAPECQASEVDAIFTEAMTAWELPTRWGNVPLKVEGKIASCWEK